MRKLLFVAAMALLCGCGGAKQQPEQEPEQGKRFEMKQYEAQKGRSVFVLSDKETGDEYILVYTGFGGVAVVSKPLNIQLITNGTSVVFIIFACVCVLLIAGLFSIPVILHIRHKKRMRKYIQKIRKAFDGVLLNERERLLLQAYLDAMECIGLRDEVVLDYKKSEHEKLLHVLDELCATRNDTRGKEGI